MQDETPSDSNESDDSDDYMDEGMKAVDAEALDRIQQMITEHLTDFDMVQNNLGKILQALGQSHIIRKQQLINLNVLQRNQQSKSQMQRC